MDKLFCMFAILVNRRQFCKREVNGAIPHHVTYYFKGELSEETNDVKNKSIQFL